MTWSFGRGFLSCALIGFPARPDDLIIDFYFFNLTSLVLVDQCEEMTIGRLGGDSRSGHFSFCSEEVILMSWHSRPGTMRNESNRRHKFDFLQANLFILVITEYNFSLEMGFSIYPITSGYFCACSISSLRTEVENIAN